MKRTLIYTIISLLALSACENETYVDHSYQGTINQTTNPDAPAISEAVDLGLSVKWAPYNIGAKQAHEYGNYYAYGETTPKDSYTQQNYTAPSTLNTLENIISTDNDAATAAWGNVWRMPSAEEIEELRQCDWEETQINDIKGVKITSRLNGNSIFLPAAGIYTDNKLFEHNNKGFYRSGEELTPQYEYFHIPEGKHFGLSVRAVLSVAGEQTNDIKVPEKNEAIDLGLSVKWAPYNIGASKVTEYGNYYAFGETEPKTNYTKDNYIEPAEFNCEGGIEMSNSDVAAVKWGNNWRMPSESEFQELFELCQVKVTNYEEIKGYEFTGPNGNTLFLPFAGFIEDYKPCNTGVKSRYYRNSDNYANEEDSYKGLPVRAVLVEPVPQNKTFPTPVPEESVDLGLSVNWAPYNVGASTESETGNYYAWGETEFKDYYCIHNYIEPTEFNESGGISGTKHDVAHVKWGNGWRMPTPEEIEELYTKCIWTEEEVGNVKGYRITSLNGNSIFIPFGGGINNEYTKYSFNKVALYRNDIKDSLSYQKFMQPSYITGALVRPVIAFDDGNEDTSDIDLVNVEFSNYSEHDYRRITMNGEYYNGVFLECDVKLSINEQFTDASISEYGIILFRNGKEIATISNTETGSYDYTSLMAEDATETTNTALSFTGFSDSKHIIENCNRENFVTSNADNTLRIKIYPNHHDFYYVYDAENMEYFATVGKTMKYKSYYTKKDSDGNETKIIIDKEQPFNMKYMKQPFLKIRLNSYNEPTVSGNYYNTGYYYTLQTSGALYLDTLYAVRAKCTVGSLDNPSSIKVTESKIEGRKWIHDGYIGAITSINYIPGEYKDYHIYYAEGILNKGNEKIKIRSNPIIFDFSKGDACELSTPELSWWPDDFTFN